MLTIIASLAILQASAAQAPAGQPTTPPPAPPACDTEGHDGFDFWVGEWAVYPNGQENQVANSRIERKFNGCAVVENWMPLRSAGGTSLNHYDAATKRWHQKWVGSSPGAVEFIGGVVEGKMVLTGYWPNGAGPGQDALTRMTYTMNDDGSVRQHGEASTDHGISWQTSFDFLYRPKEADSD
ncbi:hypothetical protein P7228_14670 [Altererythrobacter arenosus]|uniref:DUF1579 domain-containing protein n=1 Tax=Altererythrobacter arenosus TaxID=3032592 RepID=A0ABY8FSL2_9SPHN|nr:hypothetical protein [Altererythrobacter sp. CAU 1644]WFL77215.1 hypothetical protein P7228_14670 [Altererythrobacter sp. CAU 1644]